MANIFTDVEYARVPSNSFGFTHRYKTSMNFGWLYPVGLIECLPGDRITGKTNIMARVAPMIAPIFHNVDIDIHCFFTPTRIVWPNFEKFITAGVPNEDTPAYPYFADYINAKKSLNDYFGQPVGKTISKASAVPNACYNKIFNEYFRDQNVQPEELPCLLSDGENDITDYDKKQLRAWEHDYFTSCLPWPQKGEAVTLPIGGMAPIVYNDLSGNGGLFKTANDAAITAGPLSSQYDGTDTSRVYDQGGNYLEYDPNGTLTTDLSQATAVNINALRWAIALQSFLERNARGGTRYIELILAHFGVRSSDKRLQRPEFLSGSRTPFVISEVLQQSETAESPQGNMAGHGLSVGQSGYVKYFCEEHGYFMVLASIKPRTEYQQGLHRHWSKFDPLDFGWPSLANLGEQAVLNQELYYENDGQNELPFGFLPRYAEYKYAPSVVTGDLRDELDYWTLSRKFAVRPHLNESFIKCSPEGNQRIFAITDPEVDKFYAMVKHDYMMRRCLPKFGIPTI